MTHSKVWQYLWFYASFPCFYYNFVVLFHFGNKYKWFFIKKKLNNWHQFDLQKKKYNQCILDIRILKIYCRNSLSVKQNIHLRNTSTYFRVIWKAFPKIIGIRESCFSATSNKYLTNFREQTLLENKVFLTQNEKSRHVERHLGILIIIIEE